MPFLHVRPLGGALNSLKLLKIPKITHGRGRTAKKREVSEKAAGRHHGKFKGLFFYYILIIKKLI